MTTNIQKIFLSLSPTRFNNRKLTNLKKHFPTMKRFFLLLSAVALTAMVSCGSAPSDKKAETKATETSVVEDKADCKKECEKKCEGDSTACKKECETKCEGDSTACKKEDKKECKKECAE